jgi:hypothetical protein
VYSVEDAEAPTETLKPAKPDASAAWAETGAIPRAATATNAILVLDIIYPPERGKTNQIQKLDEI